MALPSPAVAQFSKGYKFLEAVRKKDGQEVTDLLNEPGTTIVNTHDSSNGDTALHIVTQRRDVTWMSFLIGKGANVDARNGQGATPLQIAVSLDFPDGVQTLLGGHAKVDEPGAQGETPLITAVHRRDIAIMRLLLKAGADPDRADNSGRSARDYAMLEGKSSTLVAEIENNARPRGQGAGARSSYGPSL
jgi:ankyrin repeat protein